MCGLFGVLSFRRAVDPRLREDARAAGAALAHRGPDNQGEWGDAHAFFVHRRLSVIDLSALANQPFVDAPTGTVTAFNGEIYNYVELRARLAASGERFATASDTEVLARVLSVWGEDGLERLDGMFAFAHYDPARRRCWLARDPMGQKPLYYALDPDGSVLFSSELGPLLALPGRAWTLDRPAFARYAMLGYYADSETPVREIRKLPPGHSLRVDETGAVVSRYWRDVPRGTAPAPADADARFDAAFAESCRRELRSDVPCGVLLSGGVDSSLVAAACVRVAPDIRTFAVASSDPRFDESAKAAKVAAALGLRHHTTIRMDEARAHAALTEHFARLDEPHGDPGFVNAHFLSAKTREHVTVAIAGDGGDELFAGYEAFRALPWLAISDRMPSAALRAAAFAVNLLPGSSAYMGLKFKARAFLQAAQARGRSTYAHMLATVSTFELGQLLPWLPARAPEAMFDSIEKELDDVDGSDPTARLLHFYQRIFLPGFVCHHTDRAAMRFGLEVRAPFLGDEVVRLANSLPSDAKFAGGTTKPFLRRALRRWGFDEAIVAQPKRGFALPIAGWLGTSLRAQMDDLIGDPDWEREGLVDRRALDARVRAHLAGRIDDHRLIFNLMAFRAWRRNYPQVSA